jgi:thioredoxin 2
VLTVCPSCGRTNRLQYGALDKTTRCGHCRTTLSAAAEPIEVPSAAVFETLIAKSSLPVVVDFWAPWCGPCRMVAPEIARVASSNAGRLVVAKVNTDDVPELGERFRIRSIPTMAVFDGGREVARTAGAMPAPQIEAFVRGAVPGRF